MSEEWMDPSGFVPAPKDDEELYLARCDDCEAPPGYLCKPDCPAMTN